MQWEQVFIYNSNGEFVGYSIHKTGTQVLKNLYTETESVDLEQDLRGLNEGANVLASWPLNHDPELHALLSDESFMPVEYVEDWVIDEGLLKAKMESGEIAYSEDPISGNIVYEDPEAIPMVYAKVPKDPGAPAARYRAAAEQIARKRASVDN